MNTSCGPSPAHLPPGRECAGGIRASSLAAQGVAEEVLGERAREGFHAIRKTLADSGDHLGGGVHAATQRSRSLKLAAHGTVEHPQKWPLIGL